MLLYLSLQFKSYPHNFKTEESGNQIEKLLDTAIKQSEKASYEIRKDIKDEGANGLQCCIQIQADEAFTQIKGNEKCTVSYFKDMLDAAILLWKLRGQSSYVKLATACAS